jgi:hypothetical protein
MAAMDDEPRNPDIHHEWKDE